MANRQELLKLNQEIELLESVGLIKAASVLHKKFIKESQAAPQPGAQSYMTNAGIEVIKPVQTPPPAQTPPPVQTVQPSLPPNYNAYDNYYQDPRTGRTVFVDPGTMQPIEGQLGKGIPVGPPGSPTTGMNINPVPTPTPTPAPAPAPAPGNTPPTFDLGIPSYKDRFDFYYGKIDQGFNIQDPQQQQAYLDRLKKQIYDQFYKYKLIDQKTFDDLMRLFAQ